ncbi:MAG: hypothetical protein AAGC93_31130 [Cyanobacteria bacterium P01_F01_bin.53]
MTNSPIDQPMSNDELRALVASNARAIAGLAAQQAESRDRLTRIEQICESNARSMQAASDAIGTLGTDIREGFSQAAAQSQNGIGDTVAMIGTVSEDVGKLTEATEVFRAEGQADRAESRDQRESNAQEHADFRVLMQSMLAEIARIWRDLRSA